MSRTLASLVAVVSLAANTWTVDDNGPADFPSLIAAMSVVADGDTLLVSPGFYNGFSTSKAVSILGKPGAQFPSIQTPVEVSGATEFTLAGFVMKSLVVNNVPGRVKVDACGIQGYQNLPAARATNCPQFHVSRSTIRGGPSSLAMMIEASSATIVDSQIEGGHGPDFQHPPANGGIGLVVRSGSKVVLAGSRVFGGAAGFNDSSNQGFSGSALRVETGTHTVARGLPQHAIAPGSASPFGTPGNAIESVGTGKVYVSGVTVSGAIVVGTPGNVVSLGTPEPWLRVTGSDIPGQSRNIELFGPSQGSALLFASLSPAVLNTPQLELPLWFDPSALVTVLPLTTFSSVTPVSLPVTIPVVPSAAGISLELQAVFPQLPSAIAPGKITATNAAYLLIRS